MIAHTGWHVGLHVVRGGYTHVIRTCTWGNAWISMLLMTTLSLQQYIHNQVLTDKPNLGSCKKGEKIYRSQMYDLAGSPIIYSK